jgi:hypothetical protein
MHLSSHMFFIVAFAYIVGVVIAHFTCHFLFIYFPLVRSYAPGKNDLPAQQRFEQLLFEESLIFKGTLNQQVYKDKIRVCYQFQLI